MRTEVLRAFKSLHRARKIVFDGDQNALEAARRRINDDFKKNKDVTNSDTVQELIKLAQEVEKELRTSVIQAVQVEPGRFRLNIRPEVTRPNVPFNAEAVEKAQAGPRLTSCCNLSGEGSEAKT